MRRRVSKEVGGSNLLSKPGSYHFMVERATDQPVNKEGVPVANVLLDIDCRVLAGTEEDQKQKKFRLRFFDGATHKDGGEFAGQILDNALMAIGLISNDDLGSDVEINLEKARNRQFVAQVEQYMDSKNVPRLRLASLNMWHVDDAEAAGVPKDESALDFIPDNLRRSQEKKKSAPKKTKKNDKFDI